MRKRLRKMLSQAVDVLSARNIKIDSADPDASHVWCIEGFRSSILPNERDLWIYVPPRYGREIHRRYPVVYLQDGQNLFVDAASTSGDSWRLQEAADRAIESGAAAPMIVVGVQTTAQRRIREYTPTADRKHPQGGGADSYVHFLVQEVKPRIDTLFRTGPTPRQTAIGGSSLGALVSLWAAMRRPDVFSGVAAMSPSIWWDDRMILREIEALAERPNLRVWVDVGDREGAVAMEGAQALRQAMLAKGWTEGSDLQFTVVDGGEHGETAWRKRIAEVLAFLFPAE